MSIKSNGSSFLILTMYQPRFYRNWSKNSDLTSFESKARETDLFICASKNLKKEALESILRHRASVEKYIEKNPVFLTTLKPLRVEKSAPEIVRKMADASAKVGVGPMASVAGAIAEFVGKDLLNYSSEIIIENGGDIFIKCSKKKTVEIFAGFSSPFTKKIGLEISPEETPLGVCTSSGRVGHSLNFGSSDAVTVVSKSAALADASATAISNIIKSKRDIEKAIHFAQKIDGLKGVIAMKDEKMGVFGNINLCRI